MRVTVIVDPLIPVPPQTYGGAERGASLLCEGLVARGHQVVLMAGPGSRTGGRLVVHRAPARGLASRAFRKVLFQPLSLLCASRADVVHNFGRIDYLWSLLKTQVPLVQRFGNPILRSQVEFLVSARRAAMQLVSVSDHQRSQFDDLASWRTVINAVDMQRFPFVEEPAREPYLAFLGRLVPNKGVHFAIEVARATGIRLRIAGNVSTVPEEREYFRRCVEPHLGGAVEWVGELSDDTKAGFLGGARALLFPIQWDEPCANVIPEALACGTPVIALRRASTPEVIVDGVSGFLCDTVEEMQAAVDNVSALRRADCRSECEKKMSADHMVESYLTIYRELCS